VDFWKKEIEMEITYLISQYTLIFALLDLKKNKPSYIELNDRYFKKAMERFKKKAFLIGD
jgi:hypothetical protein